MLFLISFADFRKERSLPVAEDKNGEVRKLRCFCVACSVPPTTNHEVCGSEGDHALDDVEEQSTAAMIAILTLGVGGLLMAGCVGLASIVVKVYACAPPYLLCITRHVFDFVLALTKTLIEATYIVLLFLHSVFTQITSPVAWLLQLVYWFVSFNLWIFYSIVRGLLGLESSAWNSLSWVIGICFVILYLDGKLPTEEELWAQIRTKISGVIRQHRNHHLNINNDNNNNINENQNRNVAVAAAVAVAAEVETEMVAAQRHQENQLLELENRENENEENALEEADRNRVNIDNVQNDQRELDRDRAEQQQQQQQHLQQVHHHRQQQQQPPAVRPRQLVDLDSSDDDIDLNMCSVCLHRARGAALFPCGHTYLCRICARIIVAAERPCPICQTPIQEVRNVYV
jgi:hypothetical protein